jgi:NADP-dependent 3-hydroxy acid dehydrogenase YdfG
MQITPQNAPSPSRPAPLAGRTTVVTGASSGIGAAIARRFAADGADVVLVARRQDRLDALRAELSGDETRVLALGADVADAAGLERVAERAVDTLGGVDVLVNAAGVMLPGDFGRQPAAEWHRMIEANLTGTLNATRAFLPALLASGAGDRPADLVNVSSIGAHAVFATYAVYAATKAGVSQLSANLRAELAPQGVRVTNVEPGLTESELAANVTDPSNQELLASMFAAFEALRADDVADLVSYAVTRPRQVSLPALTIMPALQV